MLLHKFLRHPVHFGLVLGIEIAGRAGDGRLLADRRLGVRGIDVSGRAARVDDALHARSRSGAKEILRAFDVHLPVAFRVVDGIELPGQVEGRVDVAGAEIVAQLAPRRCHVVAQKQSRTGDLGPAWPDVQPQDELDVGVGGEPGDQLLREIPATPGDGYSQFHRLVMSHTPYNRLRQSGVPAMKNSQSNRPTQDLALTLLDTTSKVVAGSEACHPERQRRISLWFLFPSGSRARFFAPLRFAQNDRPGGGLTGLMTLCLFGLAVVATSTLASPILERISFHDDFDSGDRGWWKFPYPEDWAILSENDAALGVNHYLHMKR